MKNAKLKELYKKAHITTTKKVKKGGWDNDREPFEYKTVTETAFDPEKFAELIILECAQIAYVSAENGDIVAMDILYEFNIDKIHNQK